MNAVTKYFRALSVVDTDRYKRGMFIRATYCGGFFYALCCLQNALKWLLTFQVWFQNRRAKLRREEKTKARPGRREKSQVEKTSVTLKILEVFDRDLTQLRDHAVEVNKAPSAPIVENNEQPSLASNSFSIESILSRKDRPQTEKQPSVAENIGKSFRIEELLLSSGERQNKTTKENDSSLKLASSSNSSFQKTAATAASRGPERDKSPEYEKDNSYSKGEITEKLAPFYVPLARHCGAYPNLPEEYLPAESLSPWNTEVFESFRSSSILRLRTKAEEHLKQLRVSYVS